MVGGIAANYEVSFLGDGTQTVFAAAASYTSFSIWEFESTQIRDAMRVQYGEAWWDEKFGLALADAAGSIDYSCDGVAGRTYMFTKIQAFPGDGSDVAGAVVDVDAGVYLGEWSVRYEEMQFWLGASSTGEIGTYYTSKTMGPWFVAGGQFAGMSLVANGTIRATMPANDNLPHDWMVA
jgi:hypothetical protein